MTSPAPPAAPGGDQRPAAPIFVVSGGMGTSGELLVQTALAQFPGVKVPVTAVRHLRRAEELERVVGEARDTGGTIVHTLVDADLRSRLLALADRQGVATIDVMGPLLTRLAGVLGQLPLGQPGRYRYLRQAYFDCVAAIEYVLAHDDGQNPDGWPLADIMLVGVSRTGKTPVCVYLSLSGWKAANLPIVLGQAPPPALFRLDPRRVIGLTIDPVLLAGFRRERYRRLGLPAQTDYTDPDQIREELAEARQVFREGGFQVIDVTDKPIELSADQIVQLVSSGQAAPSSAPPGL